MWFFFFFFFFQAEDGIRDKLVTGVQTCALPILAIGTIAYIGNHGGEMLRPRATRAEIDPELAAWTARVRAFGERASSPQAQRLRVRTEDKNAIVAFHWRGAPDEAAAAAFVRGIAELAEQEGFA